MEDFKQTLEDMQESADVINKKYLMQMLWDAQCDDDEVEETVDAILEWHERLVNQAIWKERSVFVAEEEVACVRCGTINEYDVSRSGDHIKATCQNCGKYIKFLKQNIQGGKLKDDSLMPYGKHKGTKLANVPSEYLRWMYENDKLNDALKEYVDENPEILD